MAYKLKPNYHFADDLQTGIDKVPIGRIIVCEDFGNSNVIKWLKKVSNTGLTLTTTIEDAWIAGNLEDSDELKRDVSDSYSQTETDALLSVKPNSTDVYTKAEMDVTINNTKYNDDGIMQHTSAITQDVTIFAGNNALSVGPLSMNDNITITLGDNSVWNII